MKRPSPSSLHVVLVHPEIHWNTGNAGRSCLAAGARLHLVEPLGFSLDDREVRRAGLDYWKQVDPTIWRSWAEFEQALTDLGEPRFFSTKAGRLYWEADFTGPTLLIFGRETAGLSTEILDSYREQLLRIPLLQSEVRSLNLSTAVGIALYEALRQRHARRGS